MESYFDIMAKHPNCLLAVDATDGGKWKSNFKSAWVMPTAPTGSGSFEETHGLLTKTNVEAENNYFKCITDAYGYIKTPLDLRGYSGDFTMIAKALVAKAEVTNEYGLLMQTRFSTYEIGSFIFLIWQKPSSSRYELRFFVQNSSNSTIRNSYTLPENFVWTMPHVFAVNYVASSKVFSLFIDGEVVATTTNSTFDSFYNGAVVKTQIVCKPGGIEPNVVKQYNVMFFDKALSADEIKILSDSMTEKNRGVKYVPFITPKNLTANDSDSEWKIFAAHSINSVTGVNPNSAEAWKAAAGMTSEAGWVTDRSTGSGIWNVVLGWRRKDNKKFVVTKVTVGLYSKTPNEYGYYKWKSYLTNRPEGDYVIYNEDVLALFADAVPWVSQTTYDERVSKPEILPERYDELSSKAFYLHFNYDLDPAEPELKNLGLNLLQLEGYVINEEPEPGLLCTTPINLTSNTSNPDWECYTEPISTGTNAHSDTAYMAAAGFTGYASNTDGGRWVADKGTALTDTSAGVRFVWKRTDLAEWAVRRVNLGNNLKSVFPQRIHHFILQGSNDGTTWTNIGEKQTPTVTMNVYNEQTFDYLSNTEKYKYWAINCNYDIMWTDVAYAQFGAAANKIQFTNEL